MVHEDEDTPLLAKKIASTLPKFQLFILLWVQLAEPITSQCSKTQRRSLTVSFWKLVAELPITGGDEAKVGYYAGLIVRRSSILSDAA
ncbi:hypothetical protein HWV62_33423 [Athelia sp. TMB]|nr:hypothetical protein HWV62_33423 [Athelia sp. TMB]